LLLATSIDNETTWRVYQKVSELRLNRPCSETDQTHHSIQGRLSDRFPQLSSFCQLSDIAIFRINELIFRKLDRHIFANDLLFDRF
jgi:hypothetical protein